MGFSKKKPKTLEIGSENKVVLSGENLITAVYTLRAINNPLRKRIIDLINNNPNIVVNKIYKKLKIEQSVASQHLAILRKAKFLISTREGKFMKYTINQTRFEEVKVLIDSF